jgi:hypothetical protein
VNNRQLFDWNDFSFLFFLFKKKKVRPFLQREKTHEQKSCVAIHPQTNQIVLGDQRTFKYDFVFGPKTQQVKFSKL